MLTDTGTEVLRCYNMDRMSVCQGTITTGSTAMQTSPSSKTKETIECNAIDGKLKQILDKDCLRVMPAQDLDESSIAAEKVADDFRDQINLKSEYSVNGMANGINDDVGLPEQMSSSEKENLITDSSSHCDCLSSKLSVCNVDDSKPSNSNDCATSVLCETNTVSSEDIDKDFRNEIVYVSYESELQMPDIMRLIQKDLSEPYSIYTYRYFIHNWPKLCFLAMIGTECVGAIVCKLDLHRKAAKRGYIAMLAVDENHRNKGIGSNLVLKAIGAMVADNADEVVLETEITNQPALRLYENLGFVRDKRLFRYYLNGVDALRLKLWLR